MNWSLLNELMNYDSLYNKKDLSQMRPISKSESFLPEMLIKKKKNPKKAQKTFEIKIISENFNFDQQLIVPKH